MSTDKKTTFYGLMLAALGVIYGDIGTSPLYAFRICFSDFNGISINEANILGVLSLIFWSLILIISVKYMFIILKADNKGEGGVLVLMTLFRGKGPALAIITFFGLFGFALLFGDGLITPAISVLSAVEGLIVVTDVFKPFVVPIAVLILVILFSFQKQGTGTVGKAFGPIMIVWFVVLAAMGIGAIVRRPDVLGAVNPLYAVNFFLQNKIHAFITLSSVFLVLTGGEALYADMGHFGKKPIQRTWFVLVLPSLLLNYFGQGAYLLGHPDNLSNIFYRLVPSWGLVPLVILATMATIIASQAIISGVFSLSRQAMQLDILPRLEIVHTSSEQEGQIYVPVMNWLLCIGVILLILGFKSSSRIANAYGVAVSMDMLFTTLMILPVMIHVWKWNKGVAYVTVLVFAFLNGAFFVSTLYKVPHGGWITLAVAGLAYVVIVVWKKGRQRIKSVFTAENIPEELFIQDVRLSHPVRVEGTAVFFTGNQNAVPKSLLHNFKHNRVLHERVIFLTVKTEHVPFVEMQDKLDIRPLGEGFYRIIARYGFSEIPDIPRMLESIQHQELRFETTNTTFFLGRISIVPAERSAIPLWQRVIFMFLSRNADDMWKYYRIPPNRVIEVGAQIEL